MSTSTCKEHHDDTILADMLAADALHSFARRHLPPAQHEQLDALLVQYLEAWGSTRSLTHDQFISIVWKGFRYAAEMRTYFGMLAHILKESAVNTRDLHVVVEEQRQMLRRYVAECKAPEPTLEEKKAELDLRVPSVSGRL